MISLTFPDGSVRKFNPGITGAELAASISKSLAKKAVAISLNGELGDLANPIATNARVKIVTRDDPEALELIQWYWGGMIREGADTFWEIYNPSNPTLSPYGSLLVHSYCHAWSCTPSWFLRARGLV